MKYFVNFPYTAETLRAEYREHCKTLHPDRGGNESEFKAMQAEYETISRDINGTKTKGTEYTAEDFTDEMNAAPLCGTKGKTFADLVARLVDVFSTPEMLTEYNTEGDLSECHGWDGGGMSPLSRAAYCAKYGRTVVELAEAAARAEMKKQADEYKQSHHAAHVREARRNHADGCTAPKVGAFVWGVGCGWKSDGARGVFVNFEAWAHDPDHYTEKYNELHRVCKVCEVYEVSAAEFADPATADRLVMEAREQGREFPGGAANDDPDREDPRDEYRYYYTECAAVICKESGRWYLINCEGYSYARYCYMPATWRTMYAAELAEAERKEAERKAEEERKEKESAAARFAEYLKKCQKYKGAGMEDIRPLYEAMSEARRQGHEIYKSAGYRRTAEVKEAESATRKAAAAFMAAQKRNIVRMAVHIFPGIKAKAVKGDNWKGGYKLVYQDGPTLETFGEMTDFDLFSMYWEEYGYDDSITSHREEFTEFAEKYTGEREGVYYEREMTAATRERLTAAIREAVPAAVGICWENRRTWTQEEINAAAAAVGVDGWELWKVYDHKHTYFNYIDIETVAEWAFDMMAFDIEAPKGKKTTRKSSEKPANEPTAAETDNTTATASEAVSEAETTAQESESAPATATEWTEAPAEGLTLEEIPGGVAVTGSSRCTYKHRKAIKAHGATWNKTAQRWEATDSDNAARLRAWFMLRDGEKVSEGTAPATDTAEPLETAQDITETSEKPADVSPLLEALADMLRTFADIMQQAKQWEGVTVPAATLERWKQETTDGTKTAAARLSEVCACLGSLTPDSRRDFDALGVIFWTLSEQLRNGADPATIGTATDYARAQLFELIDRTQTENQARAVREANEPTDSPADPFRKAA